GVQDHRCLRLPAARLPARGLPGIRYRRAVELDGPAHRRRRARGRRRTSSRPAGEPMRRSRKVKILATLGPSSSDEAMIRKLFEAGADVFRINMSHTDHPTMRELVGRLRTVEKEVGRPIGILADLQGPKLRVGAFARDKETLEVGQIFTLDNSDKPGDST